MPETHALLSASSAKRWLACPPSARLTENMPDTGSGYAAEGTLAHSLCELKLCRKFEGLKKSAFDKAVAEIRKNELYSPEMDGYTDQYIDYISRIVHGYSTKPAVIPEQRVDYSGIAPGGFGTSDCIILCGNDIHIIDFKYGKGVPVSAEDNPQLKLYALGAARDYDMLYDIRNVTLHIVQPRTEDGNSSWSLSRDALEEWGRSIMPTAKLAWEGKGEFSCGDHCRFCKAKATCRARAEHILSEAEFSIVPPELLSDDELGKILVRARLFANWLSDIEEYALNEIMSGKTVTGFKAVEGRSNRQITDLEAAFTVLKDSGIEEAMLYERKPLGLTELEKLVGGKKKLTELIGKYIEKPQGRPTLVPADDKRPDYKKDMTKIFGGNNNG